MLSSQSQNYLINKIIQMRGEKEAFGNIYWYQIVS